MKIRTRIFLFFLISESILTILGVSAHYYFSGENIKEEIYNHLETIVESRGDHIETFLDEQKEKIELISAGAGYIKLLKTDNFISESEYAEVQKRARNRFKENLGEQFYEIFLLNSNGNVVISTNENNENKNKSTDPYFLNCQEKTYIKDAYHSKTTGEDSLAVSTSINDKTGKFLGVLVARVKMEKLYPIVASRTGLGEMGEIYLINKEGYMISPSRFKENTFLKQKVDTPQANLCLEEHISKGVSADIKEIPTMYKDYRGIKVLGLHSYIPQMQWCLLAEIDQKEALAGLNKSAKIAIIIGLFLLFMLLIIVYLLSQRIVKPILELQKGVKKITKGDFNYKVGTKAKDEVGQLSRAFDKMTKAVRKSREEVDRKVENQTKKIQKNKKNLERQQNALLSVMDDVKEKEKIAIAEKNKSNAILHSIGDGVFVIDKKYNIILFNLAASLITRFSPQEVIGEKYDKVLKFIYEKDGKKNDEFIKRAMKTGSVTEMLNHTLLVRKDGSKIPVGDSAAPIKNKEGETIGCVVVFRDMAKEREIDRAKTEFVSLASHQLRTPLTSISWFSEILLSEDVGNLNKEQQDFLKEVYESSQRLIGLVNALLNVSRIELGTFAVSPKKINIIKITNNVLEELSPEIKDKKLKVKKKYGKTLEIKTDPDFMRIIFQNIITNSVKYTPKGGKIIISIKKKDKDILIKVSDNGYGIPEKQQKDIFKKLFRADNAQKVDTDGTGLGLYIVKSIIDSVGGKIWFESKENKGTTFYITLPLKGMKKKEGTRKLTI